MKCYCCESEVSYTYHVKLRGDVASPSNGFPSPNDPAYMVYQKNTEYRSAFVCPACYAVLDSADGTGTIAGRVYGISGRSRCGRAALYDEVKYRTFQNRKAAELGIEVD